jgi:hypothetical protein
LGDLLGHFGEIGPIDCGPGLHYIESDLGQMAQEEKEGYTRWLWAEINYALTWDVPRK